MTLKRQQKVRCVRFYFIPAATSPSPQVWRDTWPNIKHLSLIKVLSESVSLFTFLVFPAGMRDRSPPFLPLPFTPRGKTTPHDKRCELFPNLWCCSTLTSHNYSYQLPNLSASLQGRYVCPFPSRVSVIACFQMCTTDRRREGKINIQTAISLSLSFSPTSLKSASHPGSHTQNDTPTNRYQKLEHEAASLFISHLKSISLFNPLQFTDQTQIHVHLYSQPDSGTNRSKDRQTLDEYLQLPWIGQASIGTRSTMHAGVCTESSGRNWSAGRPRAWK